MSPEAPYSIAAIEAGGSATYSHRGEQAKMSADLLMGSGGGGQYVRLREGGIGLGHATRMSPMAGIGGSFGYEQGPVQEDENLRR